MSWGGRLSSRINDFLDSCYFYSISLCDIASSTFLKGYKHRTIFMKLVCMSFFLSVSSFSMVSAFASAVNDGSSSVIRNLSCNSNADISSSSNFDSCNARFSDYEYQKLNDEEYFEKKHLISEWSCLFSGGGFESGYDSQQVNSKGINFSSSDNEIIYDYKTKAGNQFLIKHI